MQAIETMLGQYSWWTAGAFFIIAVLLTMGVRGVGRSVRIGSSNAASIATGNLSSSSGSAGGQSAGTGEHLRDLYPEPGAGVTVMATHDPAGALAPAYPPGRDGVGGVPGVPGPSEWTFATSIPEAMKLALQQFELGHRAEAESICLEVLAVQPEHADALHLCGALAHMAGKHGLAMALLEKAVRLQPQHANPSYNLGVVLSAARLPVRAAESYRQALRAQPNHLGSLQNLGNLALEREDYAEAQHCYEAALALAPDNAVLHLALAMLWNGQRRVDLARPYFERALALDPDNARLQWEAAQYYLLCGEFARGWRLYEARFPAGAECRVWHYPFPYPRWQGEALADKHLLIHGEQGLGDEIMFLSIIPELLAEPANAGVRISLVGQPHLQRLWRTTFPQCASYVQLRAGEDGWTRQPCPFQEQLGPVDYQIPFGSLALLRRPRAVDFTRQRAYIRPDAARAAAWGTWLDKHLATHAGRLRIGIVWAGNPAPENLIANRKDAKRSLLMAEFFTLADVPGIDLVSLQTWQAAKQISMQASQAPENFRLLDCSEHLTDFAETAALVQNLDLVISVDTSVCHLAGGLGKPVWILLPYVGEWRWGLDAKRALWWPSATLFRQSWPGDWGGVIQQVKTALIEHQEIHANPS